MLETTYSWMYLKCWWQSVSDRNIGDRNVDDRNVGDRVGDRLSPKPWIGTSITAEFLEYTLN